MEGRIGKYVLLHICIDLQHIISKCAHAAGIHFCMKIKQPKSIQQVTSKSLQMPSPTPSGTSSSS